MNCDLLRACEVSYFETWRSVSFRALVSVVKYTVSAFPTYISFPLLPLQSCNGTQTSQCILATRWQSQEGNEETFSFVVLLVPTLLRLRCLLPLLSCPEIIWMSFNRNAISELCIVCGSLRHTPVKHLTPSCCRFLLTHEVKIPNF